MSNEVVVQLAAIAKAIAWVGKAIILAAMIRAFFND